MAAWTGRLGILVVACALAAWLLAGDAPAPVPADLPDASAPVAPPQTVQAPQPAHAEPALPLGADAADVATRRAQARDRRREALLERRGDGQGGYLADGLAEGECCVTGRILGADGAPVPETEVCAWFADDDVARCAADPDGRFRLDFDVVRGAFRVVAEGPGHAPLVLPRRLVEAGTHVDVGTLRMPVGLAIDGRVVDGRGAPVEGRVHLASDDDPMPPGWGFRRAVDAVVGASIRLDAEGRFGFEDLPAGRYRLRVDGGGRRDAAILERIAAGTHGMRVVVDAAEGAQRWVVRLRLPPAFDDPDTPRPWAQLVGDARLLGQRREGRVIECICVGTGPADVRLAFETSYLPAVVRDLRPPGGTIDVRPREGRTLRVQVRGLPSAALEAARLYGYAGVDADGRLDPGPGAAASAGGRLARLVGLDARGRAELTGLPDGVLRLSLQSATHVLPEGYADVRVGAKRVVLDAVPMRRFEIVFRLPEGSEVERIEYELHGVSHGERRLAHGEMRPGPAGGALEIDLPPGTPTRLIARPIGDPRLAPVEVGVPEGRTRVVVAFERTRPVVGQVVDEAGRPVVHARVSLLEADARIARPGDARGGPDDGPISAPRTATTDLEGRFELARPGAGTWRLVASAPGLAMPDGPVDVGGPRVLEVRMAPAARITGRLRGPPGTRLDGYVVTAWPEDGGPGVPASVSDGGFFEVSGLAPGPHALTAHTAWHASGYLPFEGVASAARVETGTRGVALTLTPGLVAGLALVDGKGAPVLEARVRLSGGRRREQAFARPELPVFRVSGLAPGRYRFDVEVPGRPPQQVDVEAGTTVRLVLP